jgi:hypothetical protein
MGYINLPVEGGAGGAAWGDITGTITDQSDLAAYLTRIPTYYITTGDVTGNSGVDTNVSLLSCSLAANKTYHIEVFIRGTTVNAAVWNIQHRPTYTGTIGALYATVGGAAVSNQNILSQPPASGTQLGVSTGANNTDFSLGTLFISLTVGGSATTFTYAFRSNNATSTTIKAGSHMRVTLLN